MGFSEGRSVYMGGMADHSDFQVQDYSKGKLSDRRKAEAFSSTQFANEAVRFIEERKSDKPFFPLRVLPRATRPAQPARALPRALLQQAPAACRRTSSLSIRLRS